MPEQDRETGGSSDITRRDFLDGVALTIGSATIGWSESDAAGLREDYPTQT